MRYRDLTIEDMEGIEPTECGWSNFVAVMGRAKQIAESEERQYAGIFRPRRRTVGATERAAASNPKPRRRNVDNGPQPSAPLPREIQSAILKMAGGKGTSQETTVIREELFNTDLSEGHNRVSIPMSKISESSSDDEYFLRSRDDGECSGTAAETSTAAMMKPKELSNTTKPKRRAVDNRPQPQPPPPLPEEFKNAILKMAEGKSTSQETLVIQKGLFETDLSEGHNRLSIPMSKISGSFLSEGEEEFLCRRDKNKKMNYKEVKIIDPALEWEQVRLSRWDMAKGKGKTCSTYVIKGTWRYIVNRNRLTAGDVVQLWAFRIEDELCFALVKLRD